MNERLFQEVDLGLTQMLGLIAVIAALVVWRIGAVRMLVDDYLREVRRVRSGYAEEAVWNAVYKSRVEGALRMVAIVGCGWFFYETYHYLSHVNELLQSEATLDMALFAALQEHAESVKSEAVVLAFVASLVMLLDWLVGLLWRSRSFEEGDIPKDAHAHVIPEEWNTAPTVLWDERIREARKRLQTAEAEAQKRQEAGKGSDALRVEEENSRWRQEWLAGLGSEDAELSWRDEWPVWARCVVAYQATARRGRSPDEEASGARAE